MSIQDLGLLAALTILIPIALALTASAMLLDARAVYRVDAPSPWAAILCPALVHGLAFGWGIRGKILRALASRAGIPASLVNAAKLAVYYIGWLLVAGAAAWVVAAVVGWRRQADVFAEYSSAGAIIMIILITIAYLPNAAVWGAAVLLGADVQLGQGSVNVFNVHSVPVPPLPLFAALPGSVPAFAPILLAVPAGLVIWLYYKNPPTWRQVLAVMATATTAMALAAQLSGGELGAYGRSGPVVWLAALLVCLWVGSVGLMSAGVMYWDQRRNGQPEEVAGTPVAEPQADPEAEPVAAEELEPAAEEVAAEVAATEELTAEEEEEN